MSYLQRFPIDVLKVDKSFVDPVGVRGEDAVLARAIIGLAHALHLRTVAEGIEHPLQASILHEMGCQLAQGYHFGRPMPAAQLAELLLVQAEATSIRA
jgi:EAL domain-containing protein (putative c-di-GMP-specific phosphodiesterase class I)